MLSTPDVWDGLEGFDKLGSPSIGPSVLLESSTLESKNILEEKG